MTLSHSALGKTNKEKTKLKKQSTPTLKKHERRSRGVPHGIFFHVILWIII